MINIGHFVTKSYCSVIVLCIFIIFSSCQEGEKQKSNTTVNDKYNVLFVSIDDLRPQLGCYGDPTVVTPSIDQFAKEATLFKRAYCQQALCSASRASMLTGLRPETTGITGMYQKGMPLDEQFPMVYTLPENFKDNGYFSYSIGKVFHQMGGTDVGSDNVADAWSKPAWNPHDVGPYGPKGMERYKVKYDSLASTGSDMRSLKDIPKVFYAEDPDIPDNQLPDGAMADKAIEMIKKFKADDTNFFLAVGFVKPHLPFVAPKKYWDLYDRNKIELAPNDFHPVGAPEYTMLQNIGIYKYEDAPAKNQNPTREQALDAVHGYLACISYVDAQFKKLIDALKTQNLYNNTIIVVYGDHGYQVGEHNGWGTKHSNYESSTHAPLIIRIPNATTSGKSINKLVEFTDVYPTLKDYCGLSEPENYELEGTSLRPLIEETATTWKDVAFSTYPRNIKGVGRALGTGMVTDRYRLVTWHVPEKAFTEYELYDHKIDPQENFNLINHPHYQEIIEELKTKMIIHSK
ncbi:sulfatase [Flavivirga spongiicola]|uniref:Sulfatase n=1 Tax=Flavivirga spongiicola TaxID=421621 RepID=A0ABU7XWW1_9FLAO|nr:sulfatase [Flavivirga sp. MEBiC05379]MDO5980264.1 sulfatase [Flavivirga sp. MEBiC05379]